MAALLGASPGASTAVHVMLEVLEKCFPSRMVEWEGKNKRNDSFLRHFINRKSKIIPRPSHFYRSYPWIK
ncbi:malate:quinone oxidoreductase [Bacillus pacificus]